MINHVSSPVMHPTLQQPRDPKKWSACVKLEASFLTEMLKDAGYAKPSEEFGGGIGEEQFASFLQESQAQKIAESGGIGLAKHLYHELSRKAK